MQPRSNLEPKKIFLGPPWPGGLHRHAHMTMCQFSFCTLPSSSGVMIPKTVPTLCPPMVSHHRWNFTQLSPKRDWATVRGRRRRPGGRDAAADGQSGLVAAGRAHPRSGAGFAGHVSRPPWPRCRAGSNAVSSVASSLQFAWDTLSPRYFMRIGPMLLRLERRGLRFPGPAYRIRPILFFRAT